MMMKLKHVSRIPQKASDIPVLDLKEENCLHKCIEAAIAQDLDLSDFGGQFDKATENNQPGGYRQTKNWGASWK